MKPTSIDKIFQYLQKIFTNLNLHGSPHLIWNCDETGKQFEHTPTTVCTRKGTRSVIGRTSNSRENVTILACVSAAGTAMPPMCIARGEDKEVFAVI